MASMSPVVLLALAGVGAAVAVAARRDPGVRFVDGCTGAVMYRRDKAQAELVSFARDAAYSNPTEAVDAWLFAVGGAEAQSCFGLTANMQPPPLPGYSVPALPSAATAALYLLFLDYMIDIFVQVRPTFDPTAAVDGWQAIADRFGLSDADVNAVPIEWTGD
jgi:hypothetical protein